MFSPRNHYAGFGKNNTFSGSLSNQQESSFTTNVNELSQEIGTLDPTLKILEAGLNKAPKPMK